MIIDSTKSGHEFHSRYDADRGKIELTVCDRDNPRRAILTSMTPTECLALIATLERLLAAHLEHGGAV